MRTRTKVLLALIAVIVSLVLGSAIISLVIGPPAPCSCDGPLPAPTS